MSLNQFEWLDDYDNLFEGEIPFQLLKNPLLQKDIWHTVDDLNLRISPHKRTLSLNFQPIASDWFKLLVKLYVLVRSQPNKSSNSIDGYLIHLRKFSQFLVEKSIHHPKQIDNNLFEEFDYYLKTKGLGHKTLVHYRTTICTFFDVCRAEGWLDINTYWFQGKRHRGHPNHKDVEYIPEEVWHQLEENLYRLPEPVQRMILVIKTTGIRVGELLNLPLDCLRKRGKQWRLRFTTEKYNVEDEIPIAVSELVAIIKEQQKYIRKHFGERFDRLFCNNSPGRRYSKNGSFAFFPYPKVMQTATFNQWLNNLGKTANIRTKEGKVWRFKSHQFRRTVGTVMSNAGIRDLIAQKYLRHRSPDMLSYYQHLLKQTLGDELENLTKEKKYVDITGTVVETIKPKNLVTEFIRRKMYPLTTQYGECHRPVLKSPCQTVNACWRCLHWRISDEDLDYIQEDLARLEDELKIAKTLSMTRQQQGLEDDRNNLLVIIKGLAKN
ncbi:site-specific integrase [Waterburya agarophytonicola K14]|uniref:Site-specific integrase n=1 Tax=Waterburya agarophytonicola KI4 TaxID=2874699 RepID=A0A964BU47_9CYAN|nr:site-specific integrase [Waterburya agarophytonicola]MCC0178747.1 site-specific integrase [Waterburya agarophytonicola KI4]